MERVAKYRALFPSAAWEVPERITFPAIQRTWLVEKRPEATSRVTVRERKDGVLQVSGNVGHAAVCGAALQRWWLRQGRKHLVPLLHDVGRETGQSFARASVRRQRSRWGSCSRRKAISLNAKLLFLDPALVRYVMIHELCHTREMNHAPSFWRLVQKECPDFRELRKAIHQAWRIIPSWACSN